MLPVGQAFFYLGFSHYTRIPKEITFFSFPRSSQSRFVFAFKWGSPKGVLWELTWTALPQGFRDSPPLVSKALAHDLQDVRLAGGSTLQPTDNLLCSPTAPALRP